MKRLILLVVAILSVESAVARTCGENSPRGKLVTGFPLALTTAKNKNAESPKEGIELRRK